jgi:hypothetical protein
LIGRHPEAPGNAHAAGRGMAMFVCSRLTRDRPRRRRVRVQARHSRRTYPCAWLRAGIGNSGRHPHIDVHEINQGEIAALLQSGSGMVTLVVDLRQASAIRSSCSCVPGRRIERPLQGTPRLQPLVPSTARWIWAEATTPRRRVLGLPRQRHRRLITIRTMSSARRVISRRCPRLPRRRVRRA